MLFSSFPEVHYNRCLVCGPCLHRHILRETRQESDDPARGGRLRKDLLIRRSVGSLDVCGKLLLAAISRKIALLDGPLVSQSRSESGAFRLEQNSAGQWSDWLPKLEKTACQCNATCEGPVRYCSKPGKVK